MKRLLNGEQDLFLQATGLQNGDRFLDTTAGLCSDSIIARVCGWGKWISTCM